MPPLLRRRTAALAAEGLIVTYPLVLMDLVKDQLTATARAVPLRAPVNRFAHLSRFSRTPVAPFITPNVDTLTQRPEDIDNAMTVTFDENGRMFWQDLGRMWLTDRPSRLSREPHTIP